MKYDAIFLPIEPLEERYSAQMLGWVERAFQEIGVTYKTLLPKKAYKTIQHGQWLDTFGTTDYRSRQMQMVVKSFEKGEVRDGTVFVVGDVWYPGIEAIKLMADLSGIKVKVVGWHYAGTADPADLLANELGGWGIEWENWLVNHYLDEICVGSEFHRHLLRKAFAVDAHTHSLGLAWRPYDVVAAIEGKAIQRQRIVVFPHRLAPEKNPAAFFHLADVYNSQGWDFVVSTNNPQVARKVEDSPSANQVRVALHDTKQQYYEFLASCSIYYSAATQETFGYALHEAIALGLSVVAPDRCSYSEMLQHDASFLFQPHREEDGRYLLSRRMTNTIPVPFDYTLQWDAGEYKFLSCVFSKE
jgi:glycosyltransferase involved in cell wall biosynthesis